MKNAKFLTDDEVEIEIQRLLGSDAVKLAQAETRFKYKRRQYMYQLRYMEKRGKVLMEAGVTEADFVEGYGDDD